MRMGRGTGKTMCGAKTTNLVARSRKKVRHGDIAIIARTHTDCRQTCVEGPSGILATADPDFRPIYEPGNSLLLWPNGVRGRLLSADKPESIRGLNASWIWADEVCHWLNPEKTWWEAIEPALRIGWARAMLTTTPLPGQFLKDLEAKPDTVVTRASTYDNPYLDKKTLQVFKDNYEGTSAGRQELDGDILEDDFSILWKLDTIHRHRVSHAPQLRRVVVAVDPAITAHKDSDLTGIVVAGVGVNGEGYVLEDGTCKASPSSWAAKAIQLFHKHGCDRIIAEVNQGGDMVESTLRGVDSRIPYRSVRAFRGKVLRAEPVAALYEQGKVHHVGVHQDLETQMSTWIPGQKSPDRIDALVYALTELMLPKHKQVGPLMAYS